MKPTTITIAALIVFNAACIRPHNYHPGQSRFSYKYSASDKQYGCGYFKDGDAQLAYIEFGARGAMYRDNQNNEAQLNAALKLINDARNQPGASEKRDIALYVFVHGWKNNASEDSGNVWGFRRFLSAIAHLHCHTPVVGVYIGWPGASLRNDKFLSFWNREPIADNVGNGELTEVLRLLLQAAKGREYQDKSVAVVIGHSFGGIVLERAATRLIREQLAKMNPTSPPGKDSEAPSPADLFVLVNEAGAASIARPFLLDLRKDQIRYEGRDCNPRPLILSMTSDGDLATKVAYPGGEFLSFNREAPVKFETPDVFGQTSSKPYDLLTAANMPALHSHRIVSAASAPNGVCQLPIELNDIQVANCAPSAANTKKPVITYCINAIPPVAPNKPTPNDTPYWIMSLPQVFVPDHSSVFQDYFLSLIGAVIRQSNLVNDCVEQAPPPPGAERELSAKISSSMRPKLKRYGRPDGNK